MSSTNFLKLSPLCRRCSVQLLKLKVPWSQHNSSRIAGYHKLLSSFANKARHPVTSETHLCNGLVFKDMLCISRCGGKLTQHSYSVCLSNFKQRKTSSIEIVERSCLKDTDDVSSLNHESILCDSVKQEVQTRNGRDSIILCEWFPCPANKSWLLTAFLPMTVGARIGSLFSPMANIFPITSLQSYISSGSIGSVRFYRGQTRHRGVDQNFQRGKDDEEESDHLVDKHDVEGDAADHFERDLLVVRESNLDERTARNSKDIQASTSSQTNGSDDLPTVKKTVDDLTLPELSRIAYNIVPYVKRSATLQTLVKIGVDLSKVQREEGIAELLIMSDFEKDILPLMKVLTLAGVEPNKIGYVFSANPRLFKESAQDLEMRIGYLVHKNFTLPEVATVISRAPVVLLMDPWMLDEKLGFLQKTFSLTDDEVKQVVLSYAKLLPLKKKIIADVRFHVKEFIGFTDAELKTLILKDPKIFSSDKHVLVERFDYLHNTMLISHEQITKYPRILRVRLFVFKNRHLFLMSRGRAQYDPCMENFVSLEALSSRSEKEFCEKVAKCDVEEFYDFCKTL